MTRAYLPPQLMTGGPWREAPGSGCGSGEGPAGRRAMRATRRAPSKAARSSEAPIRKYFLRMRRVRSRRDSRRGELPKS
jgi:hypothetical protein